MVLTSLLLLSGLLFPANCMNLEHVNLKSILKNIGFSSSTQGSLSTAPTLTTSTTSKPSLPPVTTGSSYPTATLGSNDDEQGSATSLPEMDSTLSESENYEREERIVNRPGQKRNQPSNVRRRGDNNRMRLGEQSRRRVETRRKIEVRQDENLWGESTRRTILRPSQVETRVQNLQMAQWDRSDPR